MVKKYKIENGGVFATQDIEKLEPIATFTLRDAGKDWESLTEEDLRKTFPFPATIQFADDSDGVFMENATKPVFCESDFCLNIKTELVGGNCFFRVCSDRISFYANSTISKGDEIRKPWPFSGVVN